MPFFETYKISSNTFITHTHIHTHLKIIQCFIFITLVLWGQLLTMFSLDIGSNSKC